MKKNAWLKYGMILLIYLAIWQGLHMVTRSWLVPGPIQTMLALWRLVSSASFYGVIGSSLLRILAGLALAVMVAVLLTLLAFAKPFFRDLFQPFMLLAKSVPVACLAIVAILWFGSQGLVWFVVFLVAVPILYQQLLTALLACPVAWREMARVYSFSRSVKIRTMALPLVQKPLRTTLALIIGMSFKAGIAAEVIAVSQHSIGDRLYMSKVYFETDILFAWIFVIMVLSYVTEKLLLLIYDGLMRNGLKAPNVKEERYEAKDFVSTRVQSLTKAFGDRTVVQDRTYLVEKPGVYAIVGASGSGKTTEMRLLCGLETWDTGVVQKGTVSMAFQEVRLLEHLHSVDNLRIACRISEREARHVAGNLLSPVLLQQPVASLSGGERRRVEVLRALLAPVSLVLLDEPFAGLDEENIRCMTELIRVTAEEKSIIISVHEPAEAERLGAVIL